MARQFVNLAEIMGQVDNARWRDQQMKSNEFDMQRQQREFERQARIDAKQEAIDGAYKGAIKQNDDGSFYMDDQELIGSVGKVSPQDAFRLQQEMQDRSIASRKAQTEEQKSQLAFDMEKAKRGRDIIATATPRNWPAVKNQLINDGYEFAKNLSDEYSDEEKMANVMGADDYLKKSESELNRGVTIRGQDITMRGQDLTDDRTRSEGALSRNVQLRGQNLTDARAREKNSIDASANGYSLKPLPATALKMQNESLEKLAIADYNNVKLGQVLDQLETGKLNLGLYSNVEGAARNVVGNSDVSSRNLSSFKSTLEKLRNDSLRLNTGVQTDGDAQRAWNELFENINDEELVKQRLKEIQEINVRGVDLQKLQVENIRGNYNATPIDFSRYERRGGDILPSDAKMPAKQPSMPKIGTVEDGHVYIGGDPGNSANWKKK